MAMLVGKVVLKVGYLDLDRLTVAMYSGSKSSTICLMFSHSNFGV